MNQVAMLRSNPFVSDPRVQAEARALDEAGYRVTVIAWDRTGQHPADERRNGVRIRRVQVPATFGRGARQLRPLLAFWRGATALLAEERPDAIHCHDLDTLPPGWLAARRRARLIYDANECYPAMYAVHGGRMGPWALELLERWLVRRVDVVVTVGELLAARFRAMTPRPVVVVWNWKDARDYQVDPAQLAALADRLGTCGRLVVAYLGGLNEDRVLLPLIQAARGCPHVFLLVAGAGSQRQAVAREMEGMGNGIYLGWLPPAELPPYVALSDVIYYGLDDRSPNNRYSTPNALFTALAAGKAMLTTSLGEVAQVVRQEGCGLVLERPSAEEIRAALVRLGEPALLHLCQARAREAGQARYSGDRARQALLGVYRDLASAPPAVG